MTTSATPTATTPGVSGIALYVPPFRVSLEDWCAWTQNPWDKVQAVVGRSFRVPGPDESVYTMAATAVLRLIENYDIDPRDIGFLGFGTESSTDNAAGAVILKGMVDDALEQRGKPSLSRACEVPEIKHACLGGIYATKSAVRWLAHDGRGRKAIVVSADIAEYERGSTGEQTQGAGAVAFLLEEDPRLFSIDLLHAGKAADYRGVDFRKPFGRHFVDGYASDTARLHDFPVFNGKYSTTCYVDAVNHALDDMFSRNKGSRDDFWDSMTAVLMHRPYHRMPIQAMSAALVWGMARDAREHGTLRTLCEEAGVDASAVIEEVTSMPRLFRMATSEGVDTDPTPQTNRLVKAFRSSPRFKAFAAEKMALGADLAMDLGNLYTASLPAWIAAAFEDARTRNVDLTGARMLTIGYGSGDAAEAIPIEVRPGWAAAAAKIAFADSLGGAQDLDQPTYQALHDGEKEAPATPSRSGTFVIDRIGDRVDPAHQDVGIEYYRYVP